MHSSLPLGIMLSMASCASVAELTLPPRIKTETDNATFELQDFGMFLAINSSSTHVSTTEHDTRLSSASTSVTDSGASPQDLSRRLHERRLGNPAQVDEESKDQSKIRRIPSISMYPAVGASRTSHSHRSIARAQLNPVWTNGTAGSTTLFMSASATSGHRSAVEFTTAAFHNAQGYTRTHTTPQNEGPYTIAQGGAQFVVSRIESDSTRHAHTPSESPADFAYAGSSPTNLWVKPASETDAMVIYDGGAPDAFWSTHTMTVGTAIEYPQAMSYVPLPTLPSIPNPEPTGNIKPPLAVYFSNTTFSATFYVDNGTDNFRAALYDNLYNSCDQYGGQCEGETATFSLDGGWMVIKKIPVQGTIEFTVGPFQFQSDAWRDYLVSAVVTAIVTPAANNSCYDENFMGSSCDFGPVGCGALNAPGITRDPYVQRRDEEVNHLDARLAPAMQCVPCRGYMNVCNIPDVARKASGFFTLCQVIGRLTSDPLVIVIQSAHPDQSSGYNEIQVQLKYNIDKKYIETLEMACNFGIDLFFGLLETFFPKARPLEKVVKKQTKKLCDKEITKELGQANAGSDGGLGDDDSDPF